MSEKRAELLANLEELARRKRENRLAYYEPYVKQQQFHILGANKRERLFMAANQVGKTVAGSFELAMHLTGRYPEGWQGRRFISPIRAWASGITGESTRDNPQRLLFGLKEELGTGAIPKACIENIRWSRGLPDAVDTDFIRHASGELSTLMFKSYERGREKWQGMTLDAIWYDEEPPADIYTEGLARITSTKGLVFITATPLLGVSEVVRRFLHEDNPDRGMVQMALDEALHIPAEEREKIVAGYPAHEIEARVRGVPVLGSGRVYPVAEEVISAEAFDIPAHWYRIVGMDFGWDHPTAAVWLAHDRDRDVVYVTDIYRAKEETPLIHAAAIKARGRYPIAWPADGLQHDKGSGTPLKGLYVAQGLPMLPEPARYPDQRANGVEAGVMDMLQRMQTRRFKVFSHLLDWFEEFRLYHRQDGKIYKTGDDLMDATRYGLVMLNRAQQGDEYREREERYSPRRARRLQRKWVGVWAR
jgi:phage terminase large subunit-like protein